MHERVFRNEKRRIEGTGEAPAWQYYHEVDELLGAHNDNSLDLSNLDESNIMNSSLISMYSFRFKMLNEDNFIPWFLTV